MFASHFYKQEGGATNKMRELGQGISFLSVFGNVGIFLYGLYKAYAK
jgi:hypothetical protein